ncbi:MAG: biopolymer transporter ExbD [Verrucomicrobia bacterium]|nr:biopolymer transporter ExbD [Verrucomicrobiota bacterium]MBI3869733.1 biopolymer transporter ExbD [Verrucomicrobiota bacterium]
MRLPRNHKVFRGQLDVAPFACVFFLLVVFLAFQGGLVLTPGISLMLPVATDLPGLTQRSIVVAVTSNGNCYYENQILSDNELKVKLRAARRPASSPMSLVLQADRDLRHERLVELCMIAREAGMDTFIAVRPETRPLASPSVITPEAP